MRYSENHVRSTRFGWFSTASTTCVVGIGMMVLLRRIFSPEWLKDVIPGLVPMNPMTATLFVLLGLSLFWSLRPTSPRQTRRARLLAAIVVSVAILKLAGILLGWQSGIDTWLFTSQLADTSSGYANRMAPNSAINMLLLGLALLFLDTSVLRDQRPSEYLAATASFISLLTLIGYAYGVGRMTGFANHIPMALNSAIAFLIAGLGVLSARPHAGWMAMITGTGPGGAMARSMLPGLVLLVAVLGWLRYSGEKMALFDSGFGITYYTLTIIVLGTLLILQAARSLDDAASKQIRLEEDRQKAFADLKKSEARVHSIIDTAYDAFISIDADGMVIDWNEAAQKMFGWSRDESLGRELTHLIVPPQHRAAHERGIRRSANSDCKDSKFLNRRVELTALRRGGAEFPIQMTIWPLGAGPTRSYNAFISDITERVEAERNIHGLHTELIANALQLEQSNKELEAFSYTISHDLRAPLRHIDGYARMLQEDAADKLDGETRRYLDEISESARRMGSLIDDLLAFSRLGRKPLQLTSINMRSLIEHVLKGDFETAQGLVHIDELPGAQGDPILLRQVWTNLISNAIKYSSPRGAAARIEIRGEHDDLFVRYRISDNGVGFDMRYVDKLFGVFQRLHPDDEFDGTGVGLAIAQRIVMRHGGTIIAEAESGVGATFTFTLPIRESTARAVPNGEIRP